MNFYQAPFPYFFSIHLSEKNIWKISLTEIYPKKNLIDMTKRIDRYLGAIETNATKEYWDYKDFLKGKITREEYLRRKKK